MRKRILACLLILVMVVTNSSFIWAENVNESITEEQIEEQPNEIEEQVDNQSDEAEITEEDLEITKEPIVKMSNTFEANIELDKKKNKDDEIAIQDESLVSLNVENEIEEKELKYILYTQEETLQEIRDFFISKLDIISCDMDYAFNLSLEGLQDNKTEVKIEFTNPYKDLIEKAKEENKELTDEQKEAIKEAEESFIKRFENSKLYQIVDNKAKEVEYKIETYVLTFIIENIGDFAFLSNIKTQEDIDKEQEEINKEKEEIIEEVIEEENTDTNEIIDEQLLVELESEDKKTDEIEEIVEELLTEPDVTFIEGDKETEALIAENLDTEKEVTEALVEQENMTKSQAKSVSRNLMNTPMRSGLAPEGVERQGDGSNIENISAKWITADTEDNDDPALLYVKPPGYTDNEQIVKLQINYALSGEHDYEPGDVTITVPVHIFKDRDGNDYGKLIIPYAEEPSTKNDFNWKRVGDTYILTNTRKMSAATKGYIQFAISGLIPHEIVDMEETAPFSAYIEVVTHRGNIIGLESNDLTAQIDTEAKVTSATKRVQGTPTRVPASEIPESQRIAGEEEYIVINWSLWGRIQSNTMYDLKMEDVIIDDYEGFIVDISSGYTNNRNLIDERNVEDDIYDIYRGGDTRTWNIKSAYPASQFDPDIEYVFNNKVVLTLTEEDPERGSDPQLVTTAEANASTTFIWHLPEWKDPTGHFMVWKNGNDDNVGKPTYTTHKYYDYYNYNDRNLRDNGYWGIYNKALNDLRDGAETYEIAYTVNTLGYIMPWTYESDGTPEGARKLENYGRHEVTMVTEEMGVRIVGVGELTLHEDYEYKAIEFPYVPIIYSAVPHNINPDGSWVALTAGDGTFLYSEDTDVTHIPEVILEIYKDNEWIEYAKANYTTGEPVVSLINGTPVEGIRVELPEGTENFRTKTTTNLAGMSYDMRPIIELKNVNKISTLVEKAFSTSNVPTINVYNTVNMKAYVDDSTESLLYLQKDGFDKLRGYKVDTKIVPKKSSRQTLSEDVDFEKRLVTIHYSAQVEQRSYINDKIVYEEAIADGSLSHETSGVWRDLLPKGVTPVLDTIRLRNKDKIVNAYTIENYKNSGRTLLVVEAELTPVTTTYRENGEIWYEDVITISFDATYGFDDIIDYGDNIHNVISYESGRDSFGSITNYKAEPDDPSVGNNTTSSEAFEDDIEKALMTNLNANHDNPVFVYAGDWITLNLLSAARTSLSKDVMTNFDGWWSDGLYYDDEEANKRTVYTSGYYQYRLRMMSDTDTISKDLILYDSLENFYAGDGNDDIDIDAPRWQGKLKSIDVSQLEAMGCAPVIYYSTVENLILSDESNPNYANHTNTDLTNNEIWIRADEYTGNIEDVKAVAIDASKTTEGEDFTLEPLESVVVLFTMKAPDAEEAAIYIAEDAHAYNNAYLLCTSIDSNTGAADSDNFVRKDYTKVGLEEYKLTVRKVWNDDNNRDGIRPEEITVRLYADGVDTGKTLTISDTETHEFTNIPYTTPDGQKIIYSIKEDAVDNYTYSISRNDLSFVITNKHEPEKISLSGTKTWVSDSEETRPEYIVVNLYANDTKIKSLTVRPNLNGEWNYEFTNLFKYENGEEISYRVEETGPKALNSYTAEYDGLNITNTYNPYGDLSLTKQVENETSACEGQEFTFVFTFTKDDEPVTEQFNYEIISNDIVVKTGTIATNDEIKLKKDETIHIINIPEYVNYTISEETVNGYIIRSSSNLTGTIIPNTTQEASVINEYRAEGRLNLTLDKLLTNRKITKSQFIFEMYDESGMLIKTASNSAAISTTMREDGTVENSKATATFGALYYNESDHGETYTYTIKERNRNKPGYSYDDREFIVAVTPIDNGNGTMTVNYTVQGQIDCEACQGTGAVEEEPCEVCNGTGKVEGETTLSFENEYNAEGEVTLRAWKTLEGRRLTDNEFEFELLDEEGNVIQTKTNSQDGSIVFDVIHYTAEDIGKTYYYAIREKKGTDTTVNYDNSKYEYSVTIIDNGDGTLSCVQDVKGLHGNYITFERTPGNIEAAKEFVKENDIIYIGIPYLICPSEGFFYKYAVTEYGIMAPNIFSEGDLANPEVARFVAQMTKDILSLDSTSLEALLLTEDADAIVDFTDNYREYCFNKAVSYLNELIETSDKYHDVENSLDEAFRDFAPIDTEVSGWYYIKNLISHLLVGENVGIDEFIEKTMDGVDGYAGWSEEEFRAWGDLWIGYDNRSEETELPVFKNTLKDGSLSVEKHVSNPEEADPNKEFRFKVKFIGEDISLGQLPTTEPLFNRINVITEDCEVCSGEGNISGYRLVNFNLEGTGTSGCSYKAIINETSELFTNLDATGNLGNLGDYFEDGDIYKWYLTGDYYNETNSLIPANSVEKEILSVEYMNGFRYPGPSYVFRFTLDGGEFAYSEDSYYISSTGEWQSVEMPSSLSIYNVERWSNTNYIYIGSDEIIMPDLLAPEFYISLDKFVESSEPCETCEGTGKIKRIKQVPVYINDVLTNLGNGEYEVSLKASEAFTFNNVPAGTSYQVWEETPDGWVLIEQENISGIIQPLETSEAKFTNKYQPGTASVQFNGTKTLDNRPATEGAFSFELWEGDTLLETVSTLNGGFIQFSVINYLPADIGTHTYRVVEVNPNRNDIDYDTHEEFITVEVTGDESSLSTNVIYDEDGIEFNNTTRPGSLQIKKTANGVTDANKNDEFTFKITLENENGTPLSGDDIIYYYKLDEKGNVIQSRWNAFLSFLGFNAMEEANIYQNGEKPVEQESNTNTISNILDNVKDSFTIDEVYGAEGDIYLSDTFCGMSWKLVETADRMVDLVLGSSGETQTLSNPNMSWNINTYPWYGYRNYIKNVYFEGDVNAVGHIAYMFYRLEKAETIDVSKLNTNGAYSTRGMFSRCSSVTSLSLGENFDTSNVFSMYGMFDTCTSLKTLDLGPNFDTSKVQDMGYMFYGCTSLETLNLGDKFNTNKIENGTIYYPSSAGYFYTYGMKDMFTNTNLKHIYLSSGITEWVGENTLFSIGQKEGYLNTWKSDNNELDPETPEAIVNMLKTGNTDGAGWWHRIPYSLELDGNGGVINGENILYPEGINENGNVTFTLPDEPYVYRAGHTLVGWKFVESYSDLDYEKPVDENGVSLYPNDSVELKHSKWKAVWLADEYNPNMESVSRIIINHYQESTDNGNYILVDREMLKGQEGNSAEITAKDYPYFHLITDVPTQVFLSVNEVPVIELYYDRDRYIVKFDGNGADYGSMLPISCVGNIQYTVPENKFGKKGSIFTGWNTAADGSGVSVVNIGKFTNLGRDGETATLYAQWLTNNSTLEPSGGTIYITVKQGETVILPDLPYGTKYYIEEINNPDGWVTSGYVNETGEIISGDTISAEVINEYKAKGFAQIVAYKNLIGRTVANGDFSFDLIAVDRTYGDRVTNEDIDNREEITTENGTIPNPYYGYAPIYFEIEYTKPGIYQYKITENNYVTWNSLLSDDDIIFDKHSELVTVTIVDMGGGRLESTVEYENGMPPVFNNLVKPGSLQVNKVIENYTDASKDAEFTFNIYFKDSEENILTDKYLFKIKHSDYNMEVPDIASEIRYSHTPNIDDDGVRSGKYPADLNIADVVTIPGAEGLHVIMQYGAEAVYYDWACVWEGNHPEYTPLTDYDSSISGKLGGTSLATVEYDIEGDSVTFGFRSDDLYNNYFGYYAVITPIYETIETGVTHGDISHGEVVTIKGGESFEISGLPDGATYEIVEVAKDGWTNTYKSGEIGTIVAGETQEAFFTNEYDTSGNIVLEGTKSFVGGDLSEKTFYFEVTNEDGDVVTTGQSKEDGTIEFTPIDYTIEDVGNTYTYYIKESNDSQEGVTYDSHIEVVTVEVNDNGNGTISGNITYDEDGIVFNNYEFQDISVSKQVTGNMGNKEQDFEFTLTLSEAYEITYTKGEETGTINTTNYTFTLSDDEEIVFSNIPKHVEFTVIENDYSKDGYTTSAETNIGEVDTTLLGKIRVSGELTDKVEIKYTNNREEMVPTKVTNTIEISGILIIFSILIILLYYKRKRA